MLAFFICSVQLSYAQTAPVFSTAPTCINADSATSLTSYVVTSNGSTLNSVQLFGDLQLVSVSPALPTTSNITIQVRSKNVGRDTLNDCVGYLNAVSKKKGFGKGRIRVSYTVAPCNNFIETDVYKIFTETPPIVGPKCISIGDTVTYSVCSILSVNQNANIGLDKYYWNWNGTTSVWPTGLQFSYFSGDSSSVTFKVVAGWTGGTLTCKFGRCNVGNSQQASLTLGLKTLSGKINVTSNGTLLATALSNNGAVCVGTKTANNPITLSLNPNNGYTYSWSSNNPSWVFTPATGTSTSLNANESAGIVYLTAVGGCDTRRDTFYINRTLDTPLLIKRTDTVTCIQLGSAVTFNVNNAAGTANLSNISFNWTAPPGWSPATITNGGPTAVFTATSSTATTGNVTVSAGPMIGSGLACSGGTIAPLRVKIKPAKPSAISGSNCIPPGASTQSYSVTTTGTGPFTYFWNNTAGWGPTSNTSSVSYTVPNTSSGMPNTISVRDTVLGGCFSDTSRLVVNVQPYLDSITISGCWNVGIVTDGAATTASPNVASTPTFSVAGAQGGVTYTWSISPTTGGSFSSSTGTSVTFNANGTPGTYTITCTPSRTGTTCTTGTPKTKTVNIYPNGTILYVASNPGVPPFITGDYLYASGFKTGSTFLWYSNYPGTLLPTPNTNQQYLFQNPATAGTTYFLEVTTPSSQLNPNRYDSFVCKTVFKKATVAYGARLAPSKTLQAALDKATVSPNPASDEFILSLPAKTTTVKVAVFSAKGQLMTAQLCNAGTNRFNTATWPAGEYFLQVSGKAGEITSRKVVIANK